MPEVDSRNSKGLWRKTVAVGDKRRSTKSGTIWSGMMYRCNPGGKYQLRRPTYCGCSVSESLQSFEYFTNWFRSQVGYCEAGWHLDKDLLVQGNTVYQEDRCVVLPPSLNSFITGYSDREGMPRGVSWNHEHKAYHSQIKTECVVVSLGFYGSKDKAGRAYQEAKAGAAYVWYTRLKAGEFVVDQRVIERMRTWK